MKLIYSVSFALPTQTDAAGIASTTVTAALTMDDTGQHAAYVGVGTPDFVMSYGSKLTFRQAQFYFPSVEEHGYRR